MVKDNEQLTVKHLRELWEKEFLPAIKSEIEAVKVQLQSQIATVNTLRTVEFSYASREGNHCEQPFDFPSSMCEVPHTPRDVFRAKSLHSRLAQTQQGMVDLVYIYIYIYIH